MKVDFLIFFEKTKEYKLHEMLSECLQTSYADNYDEPPEIDQLDAAIDIRYVRWHLPKKKDKDKEDTEEYIAGFSVDFDTEEVDTGTKIVNAFCQELSARTDDGIQHVLKLNDPYLQMRNRKYADEIFEIEMKLREAISLIFIDTYGSEFYDLLREVKANTIPNDIESKQLSAHFENEFFFLVFSDYIDLNERKLPNNAKDLIQLIGGTDKFDALIGILGSTSSSDFITGPGGALGSKLPAALAIGENATSAANDKTKITSFFLFAFSIFLPSQNFIRLWRNGCVYPARTRAPILAVSD